MINERDWPTVVRDMTFHDETRTGRVSAIVTDIDEDRNVTVAYYAPIPSMGPMGTTWDVEEIDGETIPESVVYDRLDRQEWVLESVPVGARDGDHA